ncbi:hypothetical protein M9979_12115 [Sphingomonas sp. RP10(2022)]|uniref:Uncharacterized protein n=1 Tax=Sphingomonas liriopis TaxID=2949094 RepID=A0A9X2HXY1_9SPHN|nr:hypothetical protein [Sphingomonas liriopis]MCP3735618.1 hypothetical protein [Sphingomonas liriopis]
MSVDALFPLDYDQRRAAWPELRPRLAALVERTGEPWMPEDVFHLTTMGQATLWATPDLGCFIVTQIDEQPWGRSLVVWIASEVTDARALEYMDQVRSIARDAGCDRVTFTSPRRGWMRALPGVAVRYEYSFEAGE